MKIVKFGRRTVLASLIAAGCLGGGVTAASVAATVPNPDPCDSTYSQVDNVLWMINRLRNYTDCRLDRIEKAIPTQAPTVTVTVPAPPPSTTPSSATTTSSTPTLSTTPPPVTTTAQPTTTTQPASPPHLSGPSHATSGTTPFVVTYDAVSPTGGLLTVSIDNNNLAWVPRLATLPAASVEGGLMQMPHAAELEIYAFGNLGNNLPSLPTTVTVRIQTPAGSDELKVNIDPPATTTP